MKVSKRLSEKVADEIREMILNNKMENGEPLNELVLAEKLGVSRTPIRESISMLEQEGLVKVLSGRGAFVTELTIADYREINELRSVLEPIAAVNSMPNISDAEIDEQLSVWQEVAARITPGTTFSGSELAEHDQMLHSMLIDRCKNNRLSSFLWILRRQSMRYIFSVWSTDAYNEESIKEHIEILNALKQRDASVLSAIVAEHVVINNKYIIEKLR